MNTETRAFLALIAKGEKLIMKIGIVTAVTAPSISCKIGGDVVDAAGNLVTAAPIMTGIRKLASYTPTVSDVIVLLIDEKKQIFIAVGKIG